MQSNEEQLVQEQSLNMSLYMKNNPKRYSCEAIDFIYLLSNQPQSNGIFLFGFSILEDSQRFFDATGLPKWKISMTKEYFSSMNNNTWDLIHLFKVCNLVFVKWIYKTKYAIDGSVDKYKTRVFQMLKELIILTPLSLLLRRILYVLCYLFTSTLWHKYF